MALFLKIDASRRELKDRPDFAHWLNQASAYRLSYLLPVPSRETAADASAILASHAADEALVIKAPTLDGTELWIVARNNLDRLREASGMPSPDILGRFSAEESPQMLSTLKWMAGEIDAEESQWVGSAP